MNLNIGVAVQRILYDEYDISSAKELDEALEKLQPIDISAFCDVTLEKNKV